MLHSKTGTLVVLVLLVAGCASRDAGRGRGSGTFSDASTSDAALGQDAAVTQTELEGAYAIETWTLNSSGCDFEGPSVLAAQGDRFAFVRYQVQFGQGIVSAGTCATQTECESEALAGDSDIRLSESTFDRGSDTEGWEGDFIASSWSGDSDCNSTVRTNHLTWSGTRITVRTEERNVTFSQSGVSNDECPSDTARLLAQSAPCESLQVITASPL